jgi:hypothetical protein
LKIAFGNGIFACKPMFSYGQRSECADLLNSYSDFYYLVKKVMEELHRQIYSGLPVMWKPAVSGMEKVRIRTNSKLLAYPPIFSIAV